MAKNTPTVCWCETRVGLLLPDPPRALKKELGPPLLSCHWAHPCVLLDVETNPWPEIHLFMKEGCKATRTQPCLARPAAGWGTWCSSNRSGRMHVLFLEPLVVIASWGKPSLVIIILSYKQARLSFYHSPRPNSLQIKLSVWRHLLQQVLGLAAAFSLLSVEFSLGNHVDCTHCWRVHALGCPASRSKGVQGKRASLGVIVWPHSEVYYGGTAPCPGVSGICTRIFHRYVDIFLLFIPLGHIFVTPPV